MDIILDREAHLLSELPPAQDDGCNSDDVLMDIDGYRKFFTIAHYSFESARWVAHSEGIEIEKTARWMYLPLAKYKD